MDERGLNRLQDWYTLTPNMRPVAKKDLRRVERACDKIGEAREELAEAIVAAARSGETYRDIAEAAKMSHQRVGQIVKEAKR